MKNSKNTSASKQHQLEQELLSIEDLVEKLTLRANDIKKELSPKEPKDNSIIQVGDRVRVTSHYKGRYGTIGTVTAISSLYAWVKQEAYPYRTVQVKLANLKHH